MKVCSSWKNSYNVVSLLGDRRGGGGGGWSLKLGYGVVMQKRESPDFRFPGVGISVSVVPWLMASSKVPMDVYML